METAEDKSPKSQSSPIAEFALKTVIVAIVCVVTFLGIATYVDDLVEFRVLQLKQIVASSSPKIGGREFWANVEKALDEQSDPKNEMAPEKKAKLLAQLRTLSNRWRPFLEAVVEPGRDGASAKTP